MKLVMIEMMGGTRSFVGSITDGVLIECVEIKEVIAPGPQGPMVYHIGIRVGTLLNALEREPLVFDLDTTSPLNACYNSAMNAAISKPSGTDILNYGKAGQA